MENQKYTIEDIAQFLSDYKECNKYNSYEWLINIPIIGGKLYEKVILENMKRTFLENAYNEAINGSIEKDNQFIMEMTPVLDDFYSSKEKTKIRRR